MSLAIKSLTQRPEKERFLGKFQLLKPLGQGGFAPVWLAREMLGESELRKVAIKLFSVGTADTPSSKPERRSEQEEAQARIIEEVHALCRVEHPNVVRFNGLVVDDELGVVGLVMELLTGTTLASELEFGDTLDVAKAVDLGQQLAWALTAVHRAGLVHRDIKPGNVMHEGNAYRLIDLGIASRQGEYQSEQATTPIEIPDLPAAAARTKATAQNSYIRDLSGRRTFAGLGSAASTTAIGSGTIGYMDPHSFTRSPTIHGDLYSLGATLYECLTGYVPAGAAAAKLGEVGGGLRGAVLDGREAPPSVATLRNELPQALVQLVDGLLSPDPGDRPPSAEAVACQLERIRADQSAAHQQLPAEGPFRGLGRFESTDRTVLFGRSTELAASLEMLRAHGMLALVGPSGSGKSSLARAAVAPAVEEGRLGSWPKRWRQVTVEPGNQPRERLGKAFEPFVPGAAALAPDVLLTRLQRWIRQHETGVLLLLDQLEELVTLEVTLEDQQWTARLLGALGNTPNAGISTVVGARRDLLDRLLSLADLARILPRCMLLVAPMTRETWGEVIDQALGAYGFRLEDATLRTEILTSIGDTPMPLVQFALTRLWEGRDQASKMIPRSALNQIGGIAGALNSHAESIREQLRKRDVAFDGVLRRLLIELTTPEGTRRSRSKQDLERVAPVDQVQRVLTVLAENRLLERDGDRFNFPHEALIDQWQSLRTWVSEAKADRRLLADVERDAEIWNLRRDDTLLWRGPRLVEASSLAHTDQHPISEIATQFIDTAARREQRSRFARRAWIGVGVGVVVLASIFFGIYQSKQRAFADNQTKIAVRARDDAERARNEAEAAKKQAVDERANASRAEDKAAKDAATYKANLSDLEARVNTASAADLRKIQAEIRDKLGTTETKRVTAVNASPIDRAFGPPP